MLKTVSGYEGYLVTDNGWVFSLYWQKWLKPKIDRDGYANVTLSCNGRPCYLKVHQLVMAAYGLPRPTESHFPHHKNGNRSDNWIDNLEWRAKRSGALPKGWFVYILFTDQGLPLYVGSSSWRYRLLSHEKHRQFKQRKRIGFVLRDNLLEEDAMQLEATLISVIGIRPFGPLVNKADYRTFGWRHTEGHKLRVGLRHRGKVLSAKTREKIRRTRKVRGLPIT